jgi:hypothetical protein
MPVIARHKCSKAESIRIKIKIEGMEEEKTAPILIFDI